MNKRTQNKNIKIKKINLLFSLLFLSFSAFSQTDTILIKELTRLSLEELMNINVTTPTLSAQKSGQSPATVIVITEDQINQRGYQTLADVLRDLPEFKVDDKSDPQFYNNISARGINRQDKFVIMLDGTRISSPTNEPLPILQNFPIFLAKQIEVVYGPGSALYGADAMGGVINIITKNARDYKNEEKLHIAANSVEGIYGYTNNTLLLNKEFKNDFNLTIGGQYFYDKQPDYSKIYKNEFNITPQQTGLFNSAFGPLNPQEPISAKYEAPLKAYNMYAALNKGGFSFKILKHYVQVPSSLAYTPDNAVFNKDVFYGQGVTSANTAYTAQVGNLKSFTSLTGSFYKVNPESNFRNVYGGMEHGYKYSTGSMMKADEQLTYSVSKKVNLLGGITFEQFHAVPKCPELESPVNEKGPAEGILLNTRSQYNPDGIEAKFYPLFYNNVGSYVQGEFVQGTKFSFTGGVRYDQNSRFGSTINPRLGVVFNLSPKTILKVLYGSAFWAPSPLVSYESYGSFTTTDSGKTYRSPFWHLPNPGLKPIKSKTVECSLSQIFGENFNVSLTGFYTQITDIISNVPDNGNTNLYNNKFLGWEVDYIEVPFNQGKQSSYGGNAKLISTVNIKKTLLQVYSSLSYVNGKTDVKIQGNNGIETQKTELSLVSPWQFKFGVDGKIGKFYFSGRILWLDNQRIDAFVDPQNPDKRKTLKGYSLVNASFGYNVKKTVVFYVNVLNALNQKYRAPGLGLAIEKSPFFNGNLQDPLRIMLGIRVNIE